MSVCHPPSRQHIVDSAHPPYIHAHNNSLSISCSPLDISRHILLHLALLRNREMHQVDRVRRMSPSGSLMRISTKKSDGTATRLTWVLRTCCSWTLSRLQMHCRFYCIKNVEIEDMFPVFVDSRLCPPARPTPRKERRGDVQQIAISQDRDVHNFPVFL